MKKELNLKEESVHHSNWPVVDKKKTDSKLEEQFEIVKKVIEQGLYQRDKAQIGLKWPLASARVNCNKNIKDMSEVICRQLNVKKIDFVKSSDEISVELNTTITKELEAEGFAREISRKVQDMRKKAGLERKDSIDLHISVDKELEKSLKSYLEFIKNRTGAKNLLLQEGETEKYKKKETLSIKGKNILIEFTKI